MAGGYVQVSDFNADEDGSLQRGRKKAPLKTVFRGSLPSFVPRTPESASTRSNAALIS